jgi:hypothetical protein
MSDSETAAIIKKRGREDSPVEGDGGKGEADVPEMPPADADDSSDEDIGGYLP